MGSAGAADLDARLQADLVELSTDSRPDGYPQADWSERIRNAAGLDSSIVRQVLAGKSDTLDGAHGLVERLIVARSDGTLQPFGLYVPAAARNLSLVILLHGNPQTESDILSGPHFRQLADSTGTIIAAPWGRGIYDFAQPAADEVYQVLDEVVAAYHVGPRHVFLVGYSMGGFSVFKIGPLHASRWAAVMCISGSVLNSEAATISRVFRDTPIYVVTGAKDQSIPARYGELTAAYLAGIGIPTEFEEEPTGTHLIPSLMPSLSRAWHDMIAGIVKNPPAQDMRPESPNTLPTTGGRP